MKYFKTASKALILIGALTSIGAYRGCVFEPMTKDYLTLDSQVNVQGTISEFDTNGKWKKNVPGQVRLKKNNAFVTGWQNTDGTVWKFENVALSNGVNVLSGEAKYQNESGTWITTTIPEFLIEKKTDLTDRGQQKVFLDWSDTANDAHIKAIATHTLDHSFTTAELNQFVVDVKASVKNFFVNAYRGTNIVFVDANGTDVHVVKFRGENRCDYYGQSPGDYKNQTKAQESKIYLGTFKCVIVDDDRLLSSTAAVKSDSIAQRVLDVGTFIGRTAVHEMGHSLGLTNESNLHGCEGTHNCEAYDSSNPSDRFDDGHFIMDPGPKSTIWARIGQDNSTTRKARTPVFNSYNKSYLGIIH